MANERALAVTIERLMKVLREEKKRLKAGRYSDLTELSEHKLALSDALDKMLIDQRFAKRGNNYRNALRKLARLAGENERLLAAAKDGATQARQHIKDIIRRQRNVGVYGAAGDKVMMPNSGATRGKLA